MSDLYSTQNIIRKLPDSIANQIAAGEVVQRPASVVKELVENAIDAGSTHVEVFVQDAGIAEIRVIDNGCGMSKMDAHTAFERHATSKISAVEDIFNIATKGFRGEALPSIASVSKLILKTKPETEEIGVLIRNEGSKIIEQDSCAIPTGTDISVKQLFFNTPARKKFLKSPHVEIKHIIQEMQHIAIAHPDVGFSLHDGKKVLFKYHAESAIKRIMHILGKQYADKLLPVEVTTDVAHISGYIGIPSAAKKTRGDQYFIVNSRFIKHPYFHHAISAGFEGLLEDKSHPAYCLYMQVDPSKIDVNIHPTKQEVKFEDERIIYTYVKAAVRECLAKYAVAPSIDFDKPVGSTEFDELLKHSQSGETGFSKLMEKFDGKVENAKGFQPSQFGSGKPWKDYQENIDTLWTKPEQANTDIEMPEIGQLPVEQSNDLISKSGPIQTLDSRANTEDVQESALPTQVMRKFVLTALKSGLILVNQHAAHSRILFERYLSAIGGKPYPMQAEMFPQTIELNSEEASCLEHISIDLKRFGFAVEPFGHNTFIIQGTPSGLEYISPVELLKKVLFHSMQEHAGEPSLEIIASEMARNSAIKEGQSLNKAQCVQLLDDLFACQEQFTDPFGNRTFIRLSSEYITQLFQKSLV